MSDLSMKLEKTPSLKYPGINPIQTLLNHYYTYIVVSFLSSGTTVSNISLIHCSVAVVIFWCWESHPLIVFWFLLQQPVIIDSLPNYPWACCCSMRTDSEVLFPCRNSACPYCQVRVTDGLLLQEFLITIDGPWELSMRWSCNVTWNKRTAAIRNI